MKRPHGPSLYYVSDKNIFDALNQHKVDSATVAGLFLARNIIVGRRTPRTDLARYFSCLSHDYYDHQAIAGRLGIMPRRERVTSVDLSGDISADNLRNAVDQLKQELEAAGDVVRVVRQGTTLSLEIEYSTVDYGRSEFAQVQVRDGSIEFVKTSEGYVVRSTKNPHVDDVRDSLFGKIEKLVDSPVARRVIELSSFVDPRVRSRFFYDLVTSLPGFSLRDVTGVYVYKPKPDMTHLDLGEEVDEEQSAHVERVHLRGNGVSRSELLRELLESDDYYITRIAWRSREIFGKGYEYDMEALFADPEDCTGFSYLLGGVYHVEMGKASVQRRAPSRDEIDQASRVIEQRARELITALETTRETEKEDDNAAAI